mgnify:CR=1 FL=1
MGHAERRLRHLRITTYEELYDAVPSNLKSIPMTVTSSRKHLEAMTQGEHETVQNCNMRRHNELRYAIQDKYNRPALRRIALREEGKNAVELYVKNLREDIGRLVIPSNPRTLLEAQRKANDIELWIHDANRSKMERINKLIAFQRSIRKPVVIQDRKPQVLLGLDNTALFQRMNLKCTKCGKIGHTRTLLF